MNYVTLCTPFSGESLLKALRVAGLAVCDTAP